MTRAVTVAFALVLLCLAAPAHAQSGATATGSGGTASGSAPVATREQALGEIDLLLRTLTPYNSDADLAGGLFDMKTMQSIAELRQRQLDRRQTCRATLRRTSVQSRWGTIATCYADDLSAHRVALTVMQEMVTDLEGVSAGARDNAGARLRQLLEAEEALIEGIRGKVFENEAQLLTSKNRLTEKYVRPLRQSLTQLRADRALHWVARLVSDLRATVAEWSDDDARVAGVHAQVVCLGEAGGSLLTVPSAATPAEASTSLEAALNALGACALDLGEWLNSPPAGLTSNQ